MFTSVRGPGSAQTRHKAVACRPRHRAISAGLLLSVLGLAPAHADTVRLGGTGSALGTMQRAADAYRKLDPAFRLEIVPNLGSGGGLKALGKGAIQIAVISRPLKAEEVQAGLVGEEYGRTPFVLATSRKEATPMTHARVADMLAGRQGNWSDGTPVRVVLRPASDGDTALLAAFSPGVAEAVKQAHSREGMVISNTDQDAADEMARLKGSLGTTTLALLQSEQRALTVLPLEGVTPTTGALAKGSYPHYKPMLVVTRGKPEGTAARFIAYLRSAGGKKLLTETGHWTGAADRAETLSAR